MDDGEAARCQQGAADALDDAGEHEQPASLGAKPQAAEATANQAMPKEKMRRAAEAVTERTAEEEEGSEGERVARHYPLQGGHAAAERPADGGESDADDGGIERGDARAENGGREHPAPAAATQGKRRCGRITGCRCGTRPLHCGQ